MNLGWIFPAALFALFGTLAGLGYFAALRINVGLYLKGSGLAAPLALHGLRIALLGGALFLAARFGATALMASLAGIAAAKAIAIRAAWRSP